jgi:hypothetical protein
MIRTSQSKAFALIATSRHFKLSKLENAVQEKWLLAVKYKHQPVNMLNQAHSGWVWLGSKCNVETSIVVTY